MRKLASVMLAVVVLGGCTLGPDYERPELDIPEGYIQPVDEGENFANMAWWDLFQDPQLQALIEVALVENQDLGIAVQRIEEFRALYRFTRADQYPSLDYNASGGRLDPSENTLQGSFGDDFQDNYRLSADVFFELDLFGRLRRANDAAAAELLAVEENRRNVTISLIASVASTYMLLRDRDAQYQIAVRTEETRAESLRIIEARFEKGTVPLIDVNQAEVELAVAASVVASTEREVAQTENLLSVLIGRAPGPITRGQPLKEQVMPPSIPAGLPSELLQRRPDVLATEASLAAQTARIGIAEALRWPSITLTGSLGLESTDLSTLIDSDSSYWSVGGNIFGPLLSAGRNSSRVDAEVARTEQAVLAYEQTVNRAFAEVEDALVAVRTYKAQYEARSRQVTSARSAAKLSRARYDGGVTSYLEVLDTERSLFDAELNETDTLRRYFDSVIQLYKALGGGWPPAEEEEEEEEE